MRGRLVIANLITVTIDVIANPVREIISMYLKRHIYRSENSHDTVMAMMGKVVIALKSNMQQRRSVRRQVLCAHMLTCHHKICPHNS